MYSYACLCIYISNTYLSIPHHKIIQMVDGGGGDNYGGWVINSDEHIPGNGHWDGVGHELVVWYIFLCTF